MSDLSKHNPTGRFSGLADIYAKCRPSYPVEAVQFIVGLCGLTADSLMVDIGSGTGISSRLFAQTGLSVIGIEPNDDMRIKADAETTSQLASKLSYRKGKAEETGLADGLADIVLCAQAFHWFDAAKALAEFRRILKPHGWVVLIWNERDEADPFTQEYGELLRTLPDTTCVEVPRGQAGQPLLVDSSQFHGQQIKTFKNSQVLDEEGLIGRAFSASYAPKDKAESEQFKDSLRCLFERFQKNGSVFLVYETSVYYGSKR